MNERYLDIGRMCYESICRKVESAQGNRSVDNIVALDENNSLLYVVRNFIAEAGGNGIMGYLLGSEVEFLPHLVKYLKKLNANEVLSKVYSGVLLGIQHVGKDLGGLIEIPEDTDDLSEELIEDGVYDLINNDLQDKLDQYVIDNLGAFYVYRCEI